MHILVCCVYICTHFIYAAPLLPTENTAAATAADADNDADAADGGGDADCSLFVNTHTLQAPELFQAPAGLF